MDRAKCTGLPIRQAFLYSVGPRLSAWLAYFWVSRLLDLTLSHLLHEAYSALNWSRNSLALVEPKLHYHED